MKPDKCAFCRMTRGPCTYRYHLRETLRRGAWWRVPMGLLAVPAAVVLFPLAVAGVAAEALGNAFAEIAREAWVDVVYLCGGRR